MPLDSNEEIVREKQQATLQTCLDHLSDYGVWEAVLSTVGQQWLANTDHDFIIL
jgi:hypothetical protein